MPYVDTVSYSKSFSVAREVKMLLANMADPDKPAHLGLQLFAYVDPGEEIRYWF